MFISIAKTGSGRYVFHVGDDPKDNRGTWISSFNDAAVLGDTPPTFASFGEAHAAASRLVDERPSCILAKKARFYAQSLNSEDSTSIDSDKHRELAESETVAHYIEQVEIVEQRLNFLHHTDTKKFDIELQIVEKEIDIIKQEIKRLIPMADGNGRETFENLFDKLDGFSKIVEQLKPSSKTASGYSFTPSQLDKTIVRAFSEAALLAVMPLHKDAFVRGGFFIPKTATYESTISTPNEDIVRLSFDKNLLLSGVYPCNAKSNDYSSNTFFLKYWEPIVNAIGHFHSKGHAVVAVSGLNKPERNMMTAFSMKDNSTVELTIERPVVCGHRTWILRKTAAKVTSPPKSDIAVDDEVECITEYLPTYFGRTGVVSEIISKADRMLYRVDFRRGIGPVWMDDKKLRKVNLGY